MKRKTLPGKLLNQTTIWLCCATAFCVLPAHAGETPKTTAPAEETPASNWVDFTVGGVSVSGDKAAFEHRTGQNGDFYGGISSMQWQKEVNGITWTLDGHALFGTEDYELNLRAEKNDVGYVKAGFRQFRTWYDGSGGYVPGVAGGWINGYDDDLSLDRGEAFLEAGLRMENLPEITFKYAHSWRNGDKDSTMWGASTLAPVAYAIVPTLNSIDEKTDTFNLDIAYTLGKTDLDLGLVYESTRNDDVRTMKNGTLGTRQSDVYDSDLFNAHLSSETHLNDRMLMSFGYSYTTMDTNTDGSVRAQSDGLGRHDFNSLVGGAQDFTHVANANFWWNPIDDLVVVPSLRAEWDSQSAISTFVAPNEGGAERDSSNYDETQLTEKLEVRYSGVENVLVYANAMFSQVDGDIDYLNIDNNVKVTSSSITEDKYVVGANWYPLSSLSFSGQYYHRNFDQDFSNGYSPALAANSFDGQLQSHTFRTDDVNLRLTWRALPNLTLVSRYDYQKSTIENQGINGAGLALATVDSADIKRDIFSESITWMPVSQAYLQGTVSYVLAQTDTPADIYAPKRVADSSNDYVTISLAGGYALDDRTDIRACYSYYHANDYALTYQSVGVPGSVPTGPNIDEHVFSLTLNRQISRNMIWNLGYGYYISNDDASGGNNDYHANMVSTGLQIRF